MEEEGGGVGVLFFAEDEEEGRGEEEYGEEVSDWCVHFGVGLVFGVKASAGFCLVFLAQGGAGVYSMRRARWRHHRPGKRRWAWAQVRQGMGGVIGFRWWVVGS